MATSYPVILCLARKTLPYAPSPICSLIEYVILTAYKSDNMFYGCATPYVISILYNY
jgi:hypothetical protein